MDGREDEVAQSQNAEALKLQPTDAVGELPTTPRTTNTKQDVVFSRQDVLRRMDEDRERVGDCLLSFPGLHSSINDPASNFGICQPSEWRIPSTWNLIECGRQRLT